MAPRMLTCEKCDHRFDPEDKRAFVPLPEWGLKPICPACNIVLGTRSTGAWAVWNDCNGVFTHTLSGTRRQAQETLAAESLSSGDFGGRVVPVRVIIEPEENWPFRNWDETKWEKARRAP